MFAAWGSFVHRRRWWVLAVSGIVLLASIAVAAGGGKLQSGGLISTSESGRASQLIERELPRSGGSTFTLIFSSDSPSAKTPEFRAAVEDALVPLGVGILAVVGGIAGMFLLSRFTDVSVYAENVVTLIGLGVAIDYSLFVTNRFREELRNGRDTRSALAVAMATSGRAITFSGLTVAIGLSGMPFYLGTIMSSMGLRRTSLVWVR